ncbi:winged helix DNA-binding domain-containing protein [Antrihabitans spumae]|uniref:Winged helix DNA-binding domain-containing protein n=1 Tax=Antrihabitans spumae TaxID=3373370 RepID=A0ABW7JP17_9NOCA
MQTISTAERQRRLATRHRLAPSHLADSPLEAAASMVCLHGTDPATIYLSAWARVRNMSVADLDRALYDDRTLVKHLAMRRTIFVFPRDTFALSIAGSSQRVAATERARLIREVEKAGLYDDPERWLDEASAQVRDFMSDGKEATLKELRAAIPLLDGSMVYGEGRTWGGKVAVGPRVLTTLSAAGDIVRSSNSGHWRLSRNSWSATGAWLGSDVDVHEREAAEQKLVELWLRAFGPGTETDIKWWLGSTLTAVRRSLQALQVVEVELDGGTGYLLPDDLEETAAVEPWGALLPSLDPTTMGWFDRDWYLGPHRSQLFDTNGNAGPTIWWDGRIVGGWTQDDDAAVVLQFLDDVGSDAHAVLDRQADNLTEWLGGTRVLPRFPSPLFKTS